jgi:hypothetical protein
VKEKVAFHLPFTAVTRKLSGWIGFFEPEQSGRFIFAIFASANRRS